MLKNLTATDFSEHLDTKFRLFRQEGLPIDLILTEVDDGFDQKELEQFILIFRGPKDDLLGQGSYTVKHPRMGSLDLFMIPTISSDQSSYYYQVCFCRLVQ